MRKPTPKHNRTVEKKSTRKTDHNKIEVRLDKNMRLLFEMGPDAYYIHDLKGIFIDGNKAAEKLTGYRREELIGKSFLKLNLLPRNQITKAVKNLLKNRKGQTTGPDEFILNCKDGSAVPVEIHTQPIKIGRQVLVLGSARDITPRLEYDRLMCERSDQLGELVSERTAELKKINQALNQEIIERQRSEQALKESEEKLRNIIETSADIVFRLNRSGRIEYVSPQVEGLYGYTPQMLLGKTFRFTTPHSDQVKALSAIRRVIQGKPLQHFEIRQKDIDGRLIYMEINAVPIYRDRKITGLQGIMRDITDRKKSEKILRESEEKYRDLVEKADIGILVDDYEGRFLFCNQRFADFFGYTLDEIHNMTINDLVDPADIELVKKFHRRRVAGKKTPSMYEFKCLRKDGSGIYLQVDATPIKRGDKYIGTRSYMWDVTDRKNAEEDLLRSEKKFRDLYESMRDGMVVFDRDGRILECNSAFTKMLGFPRERLLKMSDRDLTPPEWHLQDEHMIQNLVFTCGYCDLYEKEYIRFNGEVFPIEIQMYAIHDVSSIPTGMWAVIRDITERKSIEKEVNILAQTVKSVRESVTITDLNDTILYVNHAFLKTYRYQFDEIIGKQVDIIRSPKNGMSTLNKIYAGTLSGGWEGELLNIRKDGVEFPVFLSTSLIYDEKKQPIAMCGVANDISDRKKFEEQFRQAQKMEAIGQLAGGIAHDFNNILTAINGYAELALMKLETRNPLARELTGILKAGKKAGNLVRHLLAFSRKQIIKPVYLNLNTLIEDLDRMLHRLIGEDIHVQVSLAPDIGVICADPGQIEQILVNLVINSRDAINQKTNKSSEKKITIETRNVRLDRNYTRQHSGSEAGEFTCMIVSDNGIGMDAEVQNKIFEPFFTTKDKIKGTGLGLSTVYGIVKQNKGYISVYSEKDQGTSIKIYWPQEKTPRVTERNEDIIQKIEGGNETILYVEDNEEVRIFTVSALQSLGYQVIEAKNGREAYEILENIREKIDLVVSDVVMPHMGGMELADLLKKNDQDVQIILTSGYSDQHIIHSGKMKEGINFLHKPYSIEQLASKVRKVLSV